MTRKDFELIARVLHEAHSDCDSQPLDPHATLSYVSSRMATELATTNPNFDRARFLAACKGE